MSLLFYRHSNISLERPFFFVWPPQNKGTWAFWKRTALDQTGLEQKARHSRRAKNRCPPSKKDLSHHAAESNARIADPNPFPTRQFHNEHSS